MELVLYRKVSFWVNSSLKKDPVRDFTQTRINMQPPKAYPSFFYFMASEFLLEFPSILFPFQDKNLPWIKVTRRSDEQLDVRNARSAVLLQRDDTVRYRVEDGLLLHLRGPSRYKQPFHKIIADTTLRSDTLIANAEGPVSYNQFDDAALVQGRKVVHDEDRGLIEKYEVAVIVGNQGYGSIKAIHAYKGAELRQENLDFVKEVVSKYKRQPSGAFKKYADAIAAKPKMQHSTQAHQAMQHAS